MPNGCGAPRIIAPGPTPPSAGHIGEGPQEPQEIGHFPLVEYRVRDAARIDPFQHGFIENYGKCNRQISTPSLHYQNSYSLSMESR